jgi:hypothetical protein
MEGIKMLAEKYKIVPIIADYTDMSGSVTADSINMKNYHEATFILNFGTLGTASSVLYVYSGATDGATTSALTFNYAFGGAAIGTATAGSTTSCDVLAAWGSSAALTIAHATYDDFMLVVEINAAAMDTANNEEWLTLVLTDPGTAVGRVNAVAILKPRYQENRIATCLA